MGCQILITFEEIQQACAQWRQANERIVFVPTMGALHEGHMSLVKKAQELGQRVVVSIFVNPTQFGPNEDFAKYPRPVEKDIALLESHGVDVLFMPNASEVYPSGYQTYLVNNEMSVILCGRTRHNHFSGVLTVVLKLFNLVRPHAAVFGKKDYQQLKIIQKMVEDLHVNVEVVPSDTVRESSGLAKSSRNQYLTEDGKRIAAQIYGGLNAANEIYKSKERTSDAVLTAFQRHLAPHKEIRIEYAELLRQKDLKPFEGELDQPAVLLVAAHLEGVRLIDNLELG